MNEIFLKKKISNPIFNYNEHFLKTSFIDINKNQHKNQNIFEEITNDEISNFINENISLFETEDNDFDINKNNNDSFQCKKIKKIIFEDDENYNEIINYDNFSILTEKKNKEKDITEEQIVTKLKEMIEKNTFKSFLSKFNLKKETKKTIYCSICFNVDPNVQFLVSKCGHIFCNNCWKNWLKIKLECHKCKRRIYKNQLIKLCF